MCNVALMEYTI